MATHLIGLSGRKRSGKDTFANQLVTAHGYTRFAFADKLREAALAIDPIVGRGECGCCWTRLSDIIEDFGWEGVKDSEHEAEVRRTLQRVGVTARELDADIWVRPVMEAVAALDGPAVVTDMRFPNEHAAIMASGIGVRIVRPGIDTSDLHISETALDEYYMDYEFTNAGTLADLNHAADILAEDYGSDVSNGTTRQEIDAREEDAVRHALQRSFS